jgi:hypothetical protein
VIRWDIDNLQRVVAQNLEDRRQEADRAEALVDEELARCLAARRGNAVGPTITALRSRSLSIARAEAEKTVAPLQGPRRSHSPGLLDDGRGHRQQAPACPPGGPEEERFQRGRASRCWRPPTPVRSAAGGGRGRAAEGEAEAESENQPGRKAGPT